MGSEMCIRDSFGRGVTLACVDQADGVPCAPPSKAFLLANNLFESKPHVTETYPEAELTEVVYGGGNLFIGRVLRGEVHDTPDQFALPGLYINSGNELQPDPVPTVVVLDPTDPVGLSWSCTVLTELVLERLGEAWEPIDVDFRLTDIASLVPTHTQHPGAVPCA